MGITSRCVLTALLSGFALTSFALADEVTATVAESGSDAFSTLYIVAGFDPSTGEVFLAPEGPEAIHVTRHLGTLLPGPIPPGSTLTGIEILTAGGALGIHAFGTPDPIPPDVSGWAEDPLYEFFVGGEFVGAGIPGTTIDALATGISPETIAEHGVDVFASYAFGHDPIAATLHLGPGEEAHPGEPYGEVTTIADYEFFTSLSISFDPPSAEPVPEPTTLALLGVGVAGIAIARRRRKKSA